MSAAEPPVLEISGLSKTFAGQRALNDVDFVLATGEALALVGQNVSGKSTLIKVLAGYHEPDAGVVALVDGEPFPLGNAQAAFAAGLRFVHQDLGLVPTLGAIDNLALARGYLRGRSGTISWKRERAAGREMLHSLGYDFDLTDPVAKLTASERTGIAIARALEGWQSGVRVLVLDEPTASLPAAEVTRLYDVIRMVRDRGVAVIYVSHHFNEVFEICDNVTILRDGRHVVTRAVAELDEPGLIRLTIGRDLDAYEPAQAAELDDQSAAAVAIELRGVGGRVVRSADIAVRAGEIVGIAGITGSGREEIAGLLFGAEPRRGDVLLGGKKVAGHRPDLSMRGGMAMVPSDRAAKAAFLDLTLRENTTLSSLDDLYGPRGLNKRREREDTKAWLHRLEVVPPNPEAIINTLSGGNQQKVMLARALRAAPRVLILDEPTQGVDIGAKAAIHQIVRAVAADGAAVIVASTESEELVALCDRVLIFNHGEITRDVRVAGLTADDITEYTLGVPVSLEATS